jgi:CheY-like chemotaxis protein
LSHASSATILVVDDDEMNREIMEAFLSLDHYRVVTANTGTRALEACAEEIPNLILLDVNMPDMTGYEICQALRAEPATQNIPIIIVTGYSSKEDREAAFRAGANDFISRPFDAGQLLEHIRTLIQKHS